MFIYIMNNDGRLYSDELTNKQPKIFKCCLILTFFVPQSTQHCFKVKVYKL